MRSKVMAVALGLALLAVACGDDDTGLPGGGGLVTSAAPTTTTAATPGPGGQIPAELLEEAITGMMEAGIDRPAAECFVNSFLNEFGSEELVAMSDGEEMSAEASLRMLGLFEQCGVDFEEMFGFDPGEMPTDYREMADPPSEVVGPYTYGDDATLDALWDACEAGSGTACDDLYFDSPFGSEYEAYGFTCGNRMELQFDCTSLGD
jgi:hypothetical protein